MTSLDDKENTSDNTPVIIIDDTPVPRKDVHSFFSPPRKKVKQDPVPLTTPDQQPDTETVAPKDTSQNPVEIPDDEEDDKACKKRKSPTNKQTTPKNENTAKSKKKTSNKPSKQSPVTPARNAKTTNASTNKASKTECNALPFQKVTKEEALEKSEKEIETLITKTKEVSPMCSPITFQKVSKEEALKKSEKEIEALKTKDDGDGLCGVTENGETPTQKKTLCTADKKSPLSKEERQRLKEEREQQKAARLKEMEEKKKKREEEKVLKQQEKEKRELERKEKERIREEEKKKKEEERKQKEEQKEEEKKKKEEERKQKEEERVKKEEQTKAEKEKKEQERKMKEEAKKQEEEKKKQDEDAVKKKKEKEASHFRSFFTKKKCAAETPKVPVVEPYQRFKPFQVKQHMTLAPIVRNSNIDRKLLDNVLENEASDVTTYLTHQSKKLSQTGRQRYISRRKKRRELEEELTAKRKENQKRERETCSKKSDTEIDVANVVVINDDSNDSKELLGGEDTEEEEEEEEGDVSVCEKSCLYIAKLLQFSENTRPAYYGTWRKKTTHISGRKPFGMDSDVFNYDIDSDEEWIDEPGENLSDADDDDKELDEVKETDEDGFFVPHGYLSDDEGIEEEDQGSDAEDDNPDRPPPSGSGDLNEDRKLKLKACTLEKDFERKLKQRKPICIGISYPQREEEINPILKTFMKIPLFKPDKQTDEADNNNDDDEPDAEGSPKCKESKSPQVPGAWQNGCNVPLTVPEEAMPLLIQYVHGNASSLGTMNTKFQEFWSSYVKENDTSLRSHISKRQLASKIQTIAARNFNNDLGKVCYVVNEDVVKTYNITDLKLGQGLPQLKGVTPPTPADPPAPAISGEEGMEVN